MERGRACRFVIAAALCADMMGKVHGILVFARIDNA